MYPSGTCAFESSSTFEYPLRTVPEVTPVGEGTVAQYSIRWWCTNGVPQHGDSKKSIAHTYATIVGMPKNPSIHIGGRFFERSPPYHVATRWYSAAYVIFVGQFTGVCELEWPECGAFWSALRFFVDRTPCPIVMESAPKSAAFGPF